MKRSKVLLTLLCAVALVATSVFGTLAYLTDKESVTNTFTVGQVHIKLEETDIKDGGKTTTGNAYHLLPGHTYTKDPTVTVLAGSEEAYVRMLVTINKQDDLDAIFKEINAERAAQDPALAPIGIINVLTGWAADWELVKETENNDDTRTYEFRYKEIVAKSATDTELPALFKNIQMPGEITNEQLAKLYTENAVNNLKIDIVAQAIQADGFESDEDGAWAAFGTQN